MLPVNHGMENVFPYLGQGNGLDNSHTLPKTKHEIELILLPFFVFDDPKEREYVGGNKRLTFILKICW